MSLWMSVHESLLLKKEKTTNPNPNKFRNLESWQKIASNFFKLVIQVLGHVRIFLDGIS